MSQKRYRPAGARVSKSTSAAEGNRPARRQNPSRQVRRAVLAVELSIETLDGRPSKSTRVRIAGKAVRSRATPDAAFPGVRGREAMARQVTRGTDPACLARMLAAIAHPQRLTILFRLLACEATHQTLAKATGLKAGPLYYHLRELRSAGLIGPKVRDLYVLTSSGTRLILAAVAAGRLCGCKA